jgi:hypothetical protein
MSTHNGASARPQDPRIELLPSCSSTSESAINAHAAALEKALGKRHQDPELRHILAHIRRALSYAHHYWENVRIPESTRAELARLFSEAKDLKNIDVAAEVADAYGGVRG